VGLIGYKAAGGRVEAEMFMGETGQERCLDIKLLEKLAKEIADATIPALAKSQGFKSGLFTLNRNAWPKAPQGFERAWNYGGTVAKAQLKKRIAIYGIRHDGTGLEEVGQFKPEEKREEASHQGMTAEERAAMARSREIHRLAGRLGVGKFAGTPLEGRAYWPDNYTMPIEASTNGAILVAVQIKVTAEELAAQMEAATAQYDAELAEAQQQQASDDASVDQGDSDQADEAETAEA
jgi:ParB family chromosome partitioning protein